MVELRAGGVIGLGLPLPLPTEPSAHIAADKMQATGWDTENQRGVIEREIERLRVRVNREPAVSIGLGNAPGCLDRSMLNRRRIPTAFNDQVGTRETLINVAEPHSAA